MYTYIKRLGQVHYSENNSSTTLCGSPMLGNNYARESLREFIVGDLKPCEECTRRRLSLIAEEYGVEV